MDKRVHATLQSQAREELANLVAGQFKLYVATLTSFYQGLVMAAHGTVGVKDLRLGIGSALETFKTMTHSTLNNHTLQSTLAHSLQPDDLDELRDMTLERIASAATVHAHRMQTACLQKFSGAYEANDVHAVYVDRLGRARDAQQAVYLFAKMFAVSVDVRSSVLSLQNAGKTEALITHPDEDHEAYIVSLDDLSWVDTLVQPNSRISVVQND